MASGDIDFCPIGRTLTYIPTPLELVLLTLVLCRTAGLEGGYPSSGERRAPARACGSKR